jgi:hypothetical protein
MGRETELKKSQTLRAGSVEGINAERFVKGTSKSRFVSDEPSLTWSFRLVPHFGRIILNTERAS